MFVSLERDFSLEIGYFNVKVEYGLLYEWRKCWSF